ncbi:MAG: DUF692 domain-containing protein [Lacunisphaera sp.]
MAALPERRRVRRRSPIAARVRLFARSASCPPIIQRLHRLRHRDRPAHPALRPHPVAEAHGRLVRDHFGKLHGRRRPSARGARRDPRPVPRRAARRRDVLRRGRRPNREHLKKLKTLTKRTKTPWLSDHLCWGSVDGTFSHDLLPLPYTFAAAKKTAENIRQVRDYLEIPIAVENVSSYTEFHVSEMTEWEFLSEVVELADCGILLDVNNIYVSAKNHGFNPYDYLNNVPHERVAQMHIAGHTKFEKYILDTHDHPVLDPVWKMYAHATKLCGVTATLLEWDDKIPSFQEVHDEALKAHEFIAQAREAKIPVPGKNGRTSTAGKSIK